MAMAHPVPGLGKRKYLKHRQVASAPPDIIRLRQMLRPLDPQKTASIRKSARESWSNELARGADSVTTYGGLHARKVLDEPTQGRVRPTSPSRQNKPHPPNVFLVTRLRHVEGCHDPNKTVQQYSGAKERLEKYVAKNESKVRRALNRSPPPPRPHTTDDRARMQTIVGQVPAQAAEAWIKLSNDRDKASIRKAFLDAETDIKARLESTRVPQEKRQYRKLPPSLRQQQQQYPTKPQEEIYSTTRWLKKAGHTETSAVHKLLEAMRKAPPLPPPLEGPHFHITDYSPMFGIAPRVPFYDFQIHPEWHQPWHKKYNGVVNA